MDAVGSQRKRVLIVGASETGISLARMLCTAFEVVVLESNPARLEPLREVQLPEARLNLQAKDGTSLLNLKDAGVEGAEWIIALTERDEANIEVCRAALTVDRAPAALAVVGRPEAQEELKALGAEAFLRPAAMAGLLANAIQRGMRVAVNIGLGRGEVVEIPVLPSSPAVDVRLSDMRANRWLIAAIYRGGQIIVPHGNAVIRAGDRLLLSGEPDILPDIADYLRAGVARFPVQYGRRLVAVNRDQAGEGFWREVHYLAARGRVSGLTLLQPANEKSSPPADETWPTPAVTLSFRDRLPAFLRREQESLDCGCLVLPKRPAGFLSRIGLVRPSYATLFPVLPCPTLLAAGTGPYKRLVLAVTESAELTLATELAVDLSRQLGLPLCAVTVSPPDFVSGSEHIAAQAQVLKVVNDIAAQYRVTVEMQHLNGNPVRELARFLRPDDLLVLSNRPQRRASVLNPDPGMLLIEHAPCSVMVLCNRTRNGPQGRS